MRYNDIITEANYSKKFDTSVSYRSDADFVKEIEKKFGKIDSIKQSSPKQGGTVYYMDPKKGIIGYKVPNEDSPSGFLWFAAKEPFMPATKGKKPEAPKVEPKKPEAKKVEPQKAEPKPAPKAEEPPKELTASDLTLPSGYDGYYHDTQELYRAIRKRFGEIEIGRVPNGKIRHGNYGAQLGEYLLYNKANKQVVGKWESTSSDMIPGRGFTVYGYGYAAKDEAKKPEAPKAAPKKDEPYTGKTVESKEVANALSDLLSSVKNAKPLQWGQYEVHGVQDDTDGGKPRFSCEIRDWGDWFTPPDTDAEDVEDYDWQELEEDSQKDLQKIIDKYSKQYPGIKFSFSVEEKNWITLTAKAK